METRDAIRPEDKRIIRIATGNSFRVLFYFEYSFREIPLIIDFLLI